MARTNSATYNTGGETDIYGNSINTNTAAGTQIGSGTYGAIAGATDLPDVYGQLSDIYPNLGASNAAASGSILAGLQGQLSEGTLNSIQDAGAKFGITSGLGNNAGLTNNLTLKDVGLKSEAVKQQALSDYNNLLSTINKTQTVSPETQISLSQSNNALAAQANPQDATNYALDLYNQYLNQISGAGSSTKGAGGGYTINSNAGGSGTTKPFQSSSPGTIVAGAAGGGSGYQVSPYTPVTGNSYGYGVDSSISDNGYQPTSSGSMYTGSADDFDWDAILDSYL